MVPPKDQHQSAHIALNLPGGVSIDFEVKRGGAADVGVAHFL
jgi:hypothetical protein